MACSYIITRGNDAQHNYNSGIVDLKLQPVRVLENSAKEVHDLTFSKLLNIIIITIIIITHSF